ncbi:MAG: membrane dipeptidase [Anaerolineae bacterium]
MTGLPRLTAELRQAGYDEASLQKLAYQNWLRVLDLTWRAQLGDPCRPGPPGA